MKKLVAVCANESSKLALEKAGLSLGYDVKAEIQENHIIKGEVSIKDIKEAIAVLFVIDGEVEEIENIERFIDCEYYEVETKFVISDATSVINEILIDLN
ncbi:MAG: PTS sugar transporter subunit IIBC [Romboutsia sp.]